MELKIFKKGFTEKEFNDFCKVSIVYKMQFLDCGDIYVFWKSPEKAGMDTIEILEQIDRLIKAAETEVIAHTIEQQKCEGILADTQEKMTFLHTNQDEWKKLDKSCAELKVQIASSKHTIETRTADVTTYKLKVFEYLKQKDAI